MSGTREKAPSLRRQKSMTAFASQPADSGYHSITSIPQSSSGWLLTHTTSTSHLFSFRFFLFSTSFPEGSRTSPTSILVSRSYPARLVTSLPLISRPQPTSILKSIDSSSTTPKTGIVMNRKNSCWPSSMMHSCHLYIITVSFTHRACARFPMIMILV